MLPAEDAVVLWLEDPSQNRLRGQCREENNGNRFPPGAFARIAIQAELTASKAGLREGFAEVSACLSKLLEQDVGVAEFAGSFLRRIIPQQVEDLLRVPDR